MTRRRRLAAGRLRSSRTDGANELKVVLIFSLLGLDITLWLLLAARAGRWALVGTLAMAAAGASP